MHGFIWRSTWQSQEDAIKNHEWLGKIVASNPKSDMYIYNPDARPEGGWSVYPIDNIRGKNCYHKQSDTLCGAMVAALRQEIEDNWTTVQEWRMTYKDQEFAQTALKRMPVAKTYVMKHLDDVERLVPSLTLKV